MSNPTIELGGGKWATKPTSLLAFNQHPEWGYNAKEFTVDRNSTATCVGSDGLIKTVQANEARIDYSNDPNGALLVEPQRTNLIAYSEDFSQWTKTSPVILTPNFGLAPDGSNSSTKVEFTDFNQTLTLANIAFELNKYYSGFIWVKGTAGEKIRMRVASRDSEGFLLTGEWQMIGKNNIIYDDSSRTDFNINTWGADSTARIIEVWGAQLEEGSTASSYIPTNGTTVTRLADYIKDANIILDKGTLFFNAKTTTASANRLSISDDTNNNYIKFTYEPNKLLYYILINGIMEFSGSFQSPYINDSEYNAIAISWDNNEVKIVSNGQIVRTETLNLNIPQGVFTKLHLADATGNIWNFNGYTKSVKAYNLKLTDQELIDLTTI